MTVRVYSGIGLGFGTGFFSTVFIFFFETFFFETLEIFGSGLTWSTSSEILLQGIVVGKVDRIYVG